MCSRSWLNLLVDQLCLERISGLLAVFTVHTKILLSDQYFIYSYIDTRLILYTDVARYFPVKF